MKLQPTLRVAACAAALCLPELAEGQGAPPSGFGGPSSVGAELAAPHREPLADRISLGFDYSAMGQIARGDARDDAAGGVARLFGSFDLYGSEGESSGSLTFKIENRHKYGTEIAPQDLGFAVGYVGLTSLTFSDAGWVLTNLFWQHSAPDNSWAIVAGITDVTDYVDVYALGNPWAEFSNLAFSTNPTIPAPNQGFGLAGRVLFGSNGYVLAGLADANADPADPIQSLKDFFSDPEVFAHAEIGWVSSWENRFTDNVHLTFWHSDERQAAGVSSGKGVAFSASHRLGEKWIPFFRAGTSEGGGALLDRSASLGVGYDTGRKDDRIAVGINWGRPKQQDLGSSAEDQVTLEGYWRFRPLDWLDVTPDIQLVSNPALNPSASSIWLLGLRARASF